MRLPHFMEQLMKTIEGYGHISLKVPDVDGAIHFYCEGLGLRLRHRLEKNGSADSALVLTPDDIIIEISRGDAVSRNSSGITHICLDTYDIDAAFERALEYGATPSRVENPLPYNYNDLRMAFVAAPGGEEIEFWRFQKHTAREPVIDGRYIKSLPHMAMKVPDMNAVMAFYEALGMERGTHWGWGGAMKLADGRELELFTGGEYSFNTNGYAHLCFLTGDCDEAMAKAVELGGSITSAAGEWTNIRFGFCRGLAGEVIEFMQMLDKTAGFFDANPRYHKNIFV